MTSICTRWLAMAGCLAFLICVPFSGCSDDPDSNGGAGGTAGTAGVAAGGTGGDGGVGGMVSPPPPQVPGLWQGRKSGVDVCFYISADGLTLNPQPGCSITGQGGRSFDLAVDLVGTDENGQPCSFELAYDDPVTIAQTTNSFRASEIPSPGGDGLLSFSGELVGEMASGIARRDEGDSFCRVGWAASVTRECDDAAIQKCLDLLDCCRAILINPVFFETCNSVALQCDPVQCQEVLDGYPQCATEPEP